MEPTDATQQLEKMLQLGIEMAQANGVPEEEIDDFVLNQLNSLQSTIGFDFFREAEKEWVETSDIG